ncbi:MAG: four-carbon acid sugar kinase family protein, partial [Rhodospirillales bacterium]|nr:four-carbon acid sugar kinase family protein [Rhodospirillales bacterium]
MVEIAVIADDLTGAADTGIQFRPVYADTVLMADTALTVDCRMPRPDVLAVHTGTRAASPEDARRRIGETAKRLRQLEPRRVYKKVDSCLRGNLGAETEALLDLLDLDLSFIAPAFPRMGRTTVHDVHLLHGQPVADSEMGRDPATPVINSHLTGVVTGQTELPVGRVDRDILESGPEAAAAEVFRLREGGVRHVCFDAEDQAHLETIAELAVGRFPKTLLVGSAGLGLALRTVLALPAAPEDRIRVHFDLGQVRRINSAGVREWVNFIRDAEPLTDRMTLI